MNKIKDCNTCQNKVLSKINEDTEKKCDKCFTIKCCEKPLKNPSQYEPFEFKVGDYVETTDGNVGYISFICNCEECEHREFYEPEIVYQDNTTDYITNYELENGFKGYKRIGKYDFTELEYNEKSNKIEKLPYQKLIEAKDGYDVILKHVWLDTNTKNIIDKLNEVIDKINEIGEK